MPRNARIMLDPGHGGHDPGGRSLGRPEKHLVLEFQDFLWRELALRGHTVIPTRVEDVFVPLGERAALANRLGVDLFVSLHANASGSPSVRGPWTIHARGSVPGRALAELIQDRMEGVSGRTPASEVFPDESPAVGGRRLAVLRRTRMPAVLIELGFMTSPEEIRRLEDPAYMRAMAVAIADGIGAWLG